TTFGGHNYYVTRSTMTAYAAEALAQSMGGHLVTITSAAENQFIINLILAETGANTAAWIGLNDFDEEGVYRWLSGEPLSYLNWLAGNPSNSNGLEDFGEINATTVGTWNDINGTAAIIGVIELGPEKTFTAKHQYRASGSPTVHVTLTDNDAA